MKESVFLKAGQGNPIEKERRLQQLEWWNRLFLSHMYIITHHRKGVIDKWSILEHKR